jgi:hypothetical protein
MSEDTSESWLPVVGWVGLYDVSDWGRVRSVERVVAFGAQTRRVPSRILTPGRTVKGVLYVILSGNGRRQNRSVHLLVLETFVGPRPDGLEGCHWDDDSENNHLSNLRWDTHSANGRDAVRNGHNYQALKDCCPQGHKYTPENTMVGRNGGRWCRECGRIAGRRRYWENIEDQRIYKREQMRRSRANRKARAR